jgi:hypothetical protein
MHALLSPETKRQFLNSRSAAAPPRGFRPHLENLESRLALATMNLPLDVTDVRLNEATDTLEGVVSLAGQATDVIPLDVTTTAAAPDAANQCPILNLHLGEINLNLLGLHVDTSEICLDVTATDDQGLLGGLLCDLAGGLNLGGILDQLDGVLGQVDIFLGQIEDLLNDVLDQALTVTDVLESPLAGDVAAQQADELCDVLNLSLGPVDLDIPLLGVGVHLDNCDDGPVTVDVTADASGGLLGQLLCGIAGGVDTGNVDVDELVARVDRLIDQLGQLSDRLEQLAQTPVNTNSLTKQVEKLADRVTDTGDLDKLIGRVDKAIARADRILPRLL